ncbi:Protein kinase-like domain [Cordyceps militaris CM01]|uniref:Protein kinase-like domain n=1 Tax=Cordyceps militaris (strain CM01) TaxID=983644 RepID=G3JFS3_CORMM|nr:Protein kinase-like domain [Cordyceps militaris CM01]EGX92306.1 Protein kinase-like domain [Cordyceps militaris CM01]
MAKSTLPIDPGQLIHIGHGTTGVVYAIDGQRVLKHFYDIDEGAEERKALERLGSHPNIIGYLGEGDSNSIVLERGIPLLQLAETDDIWVQNHRTWIRDVADGLQYMHDKGIVHGDIGCENLVVVENRLKIIDFEGCGIDGEEARAGYKWYNRQGSAVDIHSDIFAYGCVIYQLLTGKPTFYDLVEVDDKKKIAQDRYARHIFPDVQSLPFSSVMLGCWTGQFKSMGEVLAALDALHSKATPRVFDVDHIEDDEEEQQT